MPNRKCGHFSIDEGKEKIIMVVVQRKEGNELMERMPAGGGEKTPKFKEVRWLEAR